MANERLDSLRHPPLYHTSEEAEAAFYGAFERADIEVMSRVWDGAADIACIHPAGPRLNGTEVLESWEKIFERAEPIAFHLSDRRIFRQPSLAVHVLIENILFQDKNERPLRILSTNVYRQSDQGWHLIMRHCSPAPQGPATDTGSSAMH